ncbi:MAG: hypothetical protein LAT82_04920 [Nanoarchaeota archaeon]|nr:hypothetical protein [Nanoarchaeota archaeon]
MLSSKFKFLLVVIVFLFSLDVSFSCTTIFECFEQGNFNIAEWSGNVQFQLLSLVILLFLIVILLKEDLMNRFQLESKSANLTSWILIIALILAVSLSQQSAGALRFVFLIAAAPLALLAYIIAKKVKGDENSWFSNLGLVSIGLGFYIFGRLLVIFFGSVDLLQVIPFISFIIGFTGANILDLVAIGAVFFFKHKHNKELKEGVNSSYDSSNSSSSMFGSLFGRNNIAQNSQQENQQTQSNTQLFPAKVTTHTPIARILDIEYIIKRQIAGTLSLIQKSGIENTDKQTLKTYLQDILKNLSLISSTLQNQQFRLVGTFHKEDDTIESIINTFGAIISNLDNQDINVVYTEILKMNKFFETIYPHFTNPQILTILVTDLGTHIYYTKKYDEHIQNTFKIFCDELVQYLRQHNVASNEIIRSNQQIQNITLSPSNKELIKTFITSIDVTSN